MTRCLLVQPAGAARPVIELRHRLIRLLGRRLDFFADAIDERERFPSLSLLTVAGLLPCDFALEYLDEEAAGTAATDERLARGGIDLLLVSMMNDGAHRGLALADRARARGIPSVCGGYYPSACPERVEGRFDAVVVGEAEDTLPALLADLLDGRRLAPRYVSRGDNPPERWPEPRYDLVPDFGRYSNLPLQATRGCPHACAFCAIAPLFGRSHRKKPPARVADEAARLAARAPRRPLYFCDENLTADRPYARALAEALTPLGIRYEAYADLSVAEDPELLRALRASGLFRLQIGLESLDPETLAAVSPRKAAMLPRYAEYVERIQATGIEVIAMFIVGFDRDTRETFAGIDAFMESTGCYNLNVEWLTPVPGTSVYEELRAAGRIVEGAWEREETVSFVPKRISPAALQAGTLWLAWRHAEPARAAARRKRFKRQLAALV